MDDFVCLWKEGKTGCGKKEFGMPEDNICPYCNKPIRKSLLFLANTIYKKPKVKIEFKTGGTND